MLTKAAAGLPKVPNTAPTAGGQHHRVWDHDSREAGAIGSVFGTASVTSASTVPPVAAGAPESASVAIVAGYETFT